MAKTATEAAFHEAGHAVMAMLTGVQVEGLSLNRVGDKQAHCLIGTASTEARMMVLLAGAAAMQMRGDLISGWRRAYGGFTELNPTAPKDNGAFGDYENFEQLQRANYPPHTYYQTFDRMARRVQAALFKHWRTVEKLAAALQERQTMTGAEVYALTGFTPPAGASRTASTPPTGPQAGTTLAQLRARKAALGRPKGASTPAQLRDFRQRYAEKGTKIWDVLTARIEGRSIRERGYTAGPVQVIESRVAA